ncbi:hypothetical protein VB776_23720 [Arcicella sp. DC2W]|uniref:Uncharacterized protein n=1 Tax=Arcicella gelida TaxID=2984195 RepID=A0ABU5SBX7_9BACT|nr:hypothetical protein [Arcicella sp. DC2W]MEA5405968.1 hypothetical protein [Arcicella sp. DC2W]
MTAIPIKRNQTEKNNDRYPLIKVVTKSWINPQKMNVRITANPIGNTFFKGLNIFDPK